MSSFWDKLQPAARGEAGAPASDVNYRLLVPLLLNVAIIQAVYAIVRVTTSYRAIELKLPVVWLGIISATFAILPIIFAVQVGRYLGSRQGRPSRMAWREPARSRLRRFSLRRRLVAHAPSDDGAARHFAYPHHGEPADAVRPLHRAARPRCRLRQLRHRQCGRAGARPLSGGLGRRIGDAAADRPLVHDRTDRLLRIFGDRGRHPAGARSSDATEEQGGRAAARLAAPARADGVSRRQRHHHGGAGSGHDLSAAPWRRKEHRCARHRQPA